MSLMAKLMRPGFGPADRISLTSIYSRIIIDAFRFEALAETKKNQLMTADFRWGEFAPHRPNIFKMKTIVKAPICEIE